MESQTFEGEKSETETPIGKITRLAQEKNIEGLLEVVLSACLSSVVTFLLILLKDLKYAYILATICVLVVVAGVIILIVRSWHSRPADIRAVKELSVFTQEEDDAKLLRKSGRRADVEKLVDKVRDKQFPLVVVKGPAGIGTSSVLRAGLMYELKEKAPDYWPVTPDSRLEDLQGAIEKQLAAGGFRVLIIDHFHFLRPDFPEHEKLFLLLQNVCQRPVPHDFKIVIGFRQQYDSIWTGVEEDLGIAAQSYLVGPLDSTTAKQIMARILLRAGVHIDRSILERYIWHTSSGSDVSPFLIGLATSVFARWAKNDKRWRVRLRNYWNAGGAKGLIADYFDTQLREVDEQHRPEFLLALYRRLIDPASGERKIAGDALDELATSAKLDPNRMQVYLNRLSLEDVRILEYVETEPGHKKYRLTHDCFAQVLKECGGQGCTTDIRTEWSIKEQQKYWEQNNERMRYLLRGDELSKALKRRGKSSRSETERPLNES